LDRLAEKDRVLKHVTVQGVVQGVGFRPFIYRLAREHGLAGWVINTSSAVEIEVEGHEADVEAFVGRITRDAPPRARIETVRASDGRQPAGLQGFEIRESRPDAGYQLISPDIATCADCVSELLDPADRRHRYPFTNCTNCGPRFTIITDIPYDRPNTTMAPFRMCALCRREYDDPLDRRFHAQPNACPVCGPHVWLTDARGRHVPSADGGDAIRAAARLLHEGAVVAVKGLGGFQLACDATDAAVVAALRIRKRRPDKPFAVMMRDVEEAHRHCVISDAESRLLRAPEAPIVLLAWRPESDICAPVAPGNRYLGVMLPCTPMHHLLVRDFARPLVMTSGNLSEEPIAKDNDDALRRLGGIADYFLFHDRGIHSAYDDSVCLVSRGAPASIRRARSYAPYPVKLPFGTRPILAVGAQEKNTFCLARDAFAFVSQHIGDLENIETLDHFTETVELYKRLFRIAPEAVACDLHPDYLSTRYARGLEGTLPLFGVQHHHAHVASCMAERGLDGPVIGVAFDGSGFGTDGTVWGGEFLIARYDGFERAACLEPMPLPGGEASIKRPYRLAFAYLRALGLDTAGLPSVLAITGEERAIIAAQIARRVNTPLTSSAGRLFDAASALLGVVRTISFEGQAAIGLEMAATTTSDRPDGPAAPYPFSVEETDGPSLIRIGPLFTALCSDARSGVPVSAISFRFHLTVARMISDVAEAIASRTGIKTVVLSGGCFQNRLLTGLAAGLIEDAGLECVTHRQVPCNDGGISLGQAAVAHARL
jgi:hydrogenase maturation protein HypF